MAEVVHIAVRAAKKAPMKLLDRAEVTVEGGVADDFRGRPGDRQVTVLCEEAWHAACAELGATLPWTLRRANLLVSGLDLSHQQGAHLRIGGALLVITGECNPCRVMDLQHEGLRAALGPDWRGGVTCRVRSSGVVEPRDPVVLEPASG